MAKAKSSPIPSGKELGKQVSAEMLPYRQAKSSITAGEPHHRMMGFYGKKPPSDLTGLGGFGLNIFTLSKGRF